MQRYIALNSHDKEIHKFAGQLLFENGAFEDAICAFEHEPMSKKVENIDFFLTKGKTHFLLGQFEKAGKELMTVYEIGKDERVLFDSVGMSILDCICER